MAGLVIFKPGELSEAAVIIGEGRRPPGAGALTRPNRPRGQSREDKAKAPHHRGGAFTRAQAVSLEQGPLPRPAHDGQN